MSIDFRRLLPLLLFGFVAACPSSEREAPPDLALAVPPKEPISVGAFSDCTPTGWSDVVCQSGLRCGLVMVGEPPFQGALAQCVPVDEKPLALNAPCQFEKGGASPSGGPARRYDRCGAGLGCVETESGDFRCRRLCTLRQRTGCGKQLCVLPTQVTGTGYCAAPDNCEALSPQSGCGQDREGQPLGCYVLTDNKGGGTYCLRKQSYGSSTGAIDTPCERSANCQPGLACVARPGRDATCRPYCSLPIPPDGGMPPDLGGGVRCENDLGACTPISGYDQYGRCL